MENEITENEKMSRSELKTRCADMAVKFKFLFIVTVISAVIHFILTVLLISIEMATYSTSIGISILYVTLKMLADVMLCIILFTLSRHNDGYRTAGIFYLIYSVLANLAPLLLSLSYDPQDGKNLGYLSTIFSFSSSIFSLLYILKISKVMISIFEPVSLAVKVDWREFRKWNIYIVIGNLICTPLIIIPWIQYAAFIASLIISFGSLITFIWRFTILFKSYKMMEKFSRQQD